MLSIIKQFKDSFLSIIKNDFVESSALVTEFTNSWKYKQKEILSNSDNVNVLIEYIKTLDLGKDWKKDWKIYDSFSSNWDKSLNYLFLSRLFSLLKIENSRMYKDWIFIDEIVEKLRNFGSEKSLITTWTKIKLETHSDTVKTYNTQKVSWVKPVILPEIKDVPWIESKWKLKIAWLFDSEIKADEYLQYPSIIEFLKKNDTQKLEKLFFEIYNKLKESWVVNEKTWKISFEDFWVYRNYSDIIPILDLAWYDNWRISWDEAYILIESIASSVLISRNVWWMSDKKLMSMMFDENSDLKLWNDSLTSELKSETLAFFMTMNANTSEWVNTLLRKLWYSNWIYTLRERVGKNPFKAKEDFLLLLKTKQEQVGSFIKLTQGWKKIKEYWVDKNLTELTPEKFNQIFNDVKKKLRENWRNLNREEEETLGELIKAIKPDVLFGGYVNWNAFVWAGYNVPIVEEITNWFLDLTAWAWISSVWPWLFANVEIWKDFFSKYGASLNVWATNFIPYISWKLNLVEWDDVDVNWHLTLLPWIIVPWISFEFKNPNTQLWIKAETEKFINMLSYVVKRDYSKCKPEDRDFFENIYNIIKTIPKKDQQQLIQNIVNSFHLKLQKRASEKEWLFNIRWFHLSWVSLSAIIWGPLVVLLPWVSAEYVTVWFTPAWYAPSKERNMTNVEMSKDKLQKYWVKKENYHDKKVISMNVLEWTYDEIHQIVDNTWKAQFEKVWNKLYISWISLSEFNKSIVSTSWENKNNTSTILNTLIIWWWEINNPVLLWNWRRINSDIVNYWSEKLWTIDNSDIEAVAPVKNTLNSIINKKSLDRYKWMRKLQWHITWFLNNWNSDLNSVWNESIKVLGMDANYIYWSKNFTDIQKQLILQSLFTNLSSNHDGTQPLKKETEEKYQKRDRLFDSILEDAKISKDWRNIISRLRRSFYENDDKNHTLLNDNSVWFSLTVTKDWSAKKWITPLVWAFDIIWTPVNLNLSIEDRNKFIDRIPDNILFGYQAQLRSQWLILNNLQEVRNFIKSDQAEVSMRFCKNAECLNDFILLDVKFGNLTLNANANMWYNRWEFSVTNGFAVVSKSIPRKPKTPETPKIADKPKTEPEQEEYKWPDTKPENDTLKTWQWNSLNNNWSNSATNNGLYSWTKNVSAWWVESRPSSQIGNTSNVNYWATWSWSTWATANTWSVWMKPNSSSARQK